MVSQTLFSSKTGEWETPQKLFDKLNEEFNFVFDLAASKENAKCSEFFTKENDALSKHWPDSKDGYLWCNPPYGRDVGNWVGHASRQNEIFDRRIVMLLPARTDTKWFHDYLYKWPRVEVRFIRGRLKFGGSPNTAPFPSMVVVFGTNKT